MPARDSVYDEILAELENEQVAKPKETAVTREALKNHAHWMMINHGYIHSTQTLKALADYDKGYGLFLIGNYGTGKTMFFQAVGNTNIRIFSLLRHLATPLEDIEAEIRSCYNNDLVIDDIGAEPIYNNYGNKIDLLPWVIENRIYLKSKTHFTSNLSVGQIEKRYGGRVIDRIAGMCRTHKFTGESMRVAKPKQKNAR